MGARINYCFKVDEGDVYVYLYSHWGETTWRQDLAQALDTARPRWSDDNYCLRIIVDQLSKAGQTHCGSHALDPEDYDACFGDMIIQYAIFGKLIYG